MKVVKTILISSFIIILLTQAVFGIGEVTSTADDWLETGKKHTDKTMDTQKLKDVSGDLYNMLLAVATAVAVIIGGILGIQYMTAGISKKVEVKESLFPYLISCIVVFGSMGIWKLVVVIMSSF